MPPCHGMPLYANEHHRRFQARCRPLHRVAPFLLAGGQHKAWRRAQISLPPCLHVSMSHCHLGILSKPPCHKFDQVGAMADDGGAPPDTGGDGRLQALLLLCHYTTMYALRRGELVWASAGDWVVGWLGNLQSGVVCRAACHATRLRSRSRPRGSPAGDGGGASAEAALADAQQHLLAAQFAVSRGAGAVHAAERREEDASPMSRLSSLPPCHHATMPSCHHVRMHNVTATAGVGVGGAALAGPRRRALVRVGGSDVARGLRSGAVGEAIPCPQQVPKPGGVSGPRGA